MNKTPPAQTQSTVTRRHFVRTAGTAVAVAPFAVQALARAAAEDTINVGVVGCGGRGTGAAANALEASESVRIYALADVFPDHLAQCRQNLEGLGERGRVAEDRCFSGFDAYRQLLDTDVDVVILATPPHFRPAHFTAAVEAGKNVFMEKPVAVDPAGIRMVLAAGEIADQKNLSVVAGTQRRHEESYLQSMAKLEEGAIGRIIAARCFWNMGGLWMKEPRDEWTDMEWQLRNWLYFTWLSGDHIVEQHVHNLDVVNWAMGAHPVKALGTGGRQARTDPNYGHIFDHFAIEYEYPDNRFLLSMCRQQDGTPGRVEEIIHGTEGYLRIRPGHATIYSEDPWRFARAEVNPYVQEHRDLYASIQSGPRLNEARQVAESTLTAIMGRMSAYTGQEVTWEQAMNSTLDLTPATYEFGPLPPVAVAIPGKTRLE